MDGIPHVNVELLVQEQKRREESFKKKICIVEWVVLPSVFAALVGCGALATLGLRRQWSWVSPALPPAFAACGSAFVVSYWATKLLHGACE
jgi:hypothetical protein